MKRRRQLNALPVSVSAQRSKRRLRIMLCFFFLGLAVPIAYLIYQVYAQFEHETRYQYRNLAENLVTRIDQRMTAILDKEEQRPFAEYSFFTVEENPLIKSTGVAFSPLSHYPLNSTIPGIIGYFQIDPNMGFGSPVLPELDYLSSATPIADFSETELQNRLSLREKLKNILLSQAPLQKDHRDNDTALFESETEQSSLQAGVTPSVTSKRSEPQVNRSSKSNFDQIFKYDSKMERNIVSADSVQEEQKLAAAPQTQTRPIESGFSDEYWRERSEIGAKGSGIGSLNEKKAKVKSRMSRKEQVQIPDQIAASTFYNRPSRRIQLNRDLQEATTTANEKRVVELDDPITDALDQSLVKQLSDKDSQLTVSILRFESEIEPLKMLLVEDLYFCFYRNVWQKNGRYIQGFLVNRKQFLNDIAAFALDESQIGKIVRVFTLYKGRVLDQLGVDIDEDRAKQAVADFPHDLVFRSFAAPPLSDLELMVTLDNLPANSGKRLVDGLVTVLALILGGGLFGLYRIGTKQIDLADQQTNFVSAVSHELKTPLTSIRMYSELLREGWVSDQPKKKSYYDFIFFESERLSRLISNVLELSKISHNNSRLSLNPCRPGTLLNRVKEKVQSQIEAADFELKIVETNIGAADFQIDVDEDAFHQIFINLVDNALKFAADASRPVVEIGFRVDALAARACVYFVRDFGPGIAKTTNNKLFKLFYRGENEMTRTKPGSGIGLALVKQLAQRMNANVELINRRPGLEVRVAFPKYT